MTHLNESEEKEAKEWIKAAAMTARLGSLGLGNYLQIMSPILGKSLGTENARGVSFMDPLFCSGMEPPELSAHSFLDGLSHMFGLPSNQTHARPLSLVDVPSILQREGDIHGGFGRQIDTYADLVVFSLCGTSWNGKGENKSNDSPRGW